MWVLYALCALAVCATVIVTRIAWWMSHNAIARWKIRHYGANLPRPMMVPTVGSGPMICWLGMRGIVTLAAGLALPGAFPFRELIVFCAFAVVLATLVLQGAAYARFGHVAVFFCPAQGISGAPGVRRPAVRGFACREFLVFGAAASRYHRAKPDLARPPGAGCDRRRGVPGPGRETGCPGTERGPEGQTVVTARKSACFAQKTGIKSRIFLPCVAREGLPRNAAERTLRGPTRKPSRISG